MARAGSAGSSAPRWRRCTSWGKRPPPSSPSPFPISGSGSRSGRATSGGQVGVSTRVLFLLATGGRVVRGRPRGSWLSSQYRWAPTDVWLGAPLPKLDHAEASASLLRRWLLTFGPGTLTDIRWWTGWTLRQTKAALAALEVAEVALEGDITGYVMADDTEALEPPEPWVAFLPSLDPTIMGWKERDWYLGAHAELLFDRNGNAGPTIWADGRVIGGWAQMADGTIATKLLERVDRATGRRVQGERDRLAEWLGTHARHREVPEPGRPGAHGLALTASAPRGSGGRPRPS